MKYGHNSGGIWPVSKGRKPTKEYSRWASLMSRCYNTNNQAYPRYGGDGVTVCDEWHDFQVFAQWFSENNVDDWPMDKDCDGGSVYSPDTVVFVPEQVNQLLKCYTIPMCGVKKATNTWYVQTKDVDNRQHVMGKFTSPESANDYYQGYIRLKMAALVDKCAIPAATAARLLSL